MCVHVCVCAHVCVCVAVCVSCMHVKQNHTCKVMPYAGALKLVYLPCCSKTVVNVKKRTLIVSSINLVIGLQHKIITVLFTILFV